MSKKIANIDRFSFFKSYALAIERLKQKDSKLELLNAIYKYVWFNESPTFTEEERELKEMAWECIEPNLKNSKNKSKNAKKDKNK